MAISCNPCGIVSAAHNLQVIAHDSCSANISINNNAGISVNIYPNPTEETFTLEISAVSTATVIEVFDILGKLVNKRAVENVTNVKEIFIMKGNTSGMYLIKIEVDGEVFCRKVMLL